MELFVSRMGALDNIHTGKSTFMVELMVHDYVCYMYLHTCIKYLPHVHAQEVK